MTGRLNTFPTGSGSPGTLNQRRENASRQHQIGRESLDQRIPLHLQVHPNRGQHKKSQDKSRRLDQRIEIQTGQQEKGKQYLAETNCPKRPFRQTINRKFLLNFRLPPTERGGSTKTKEPNTEQGYRDQCLKDLLRPLDHKDKATRDISNCPNRNNRSCRACPNTGETSSTKQPRGSCRKDRQKFCLLGRSTGRRLN